MSSVAAPAFVAAPAPLPKGASAIVVLGSAGGVQTQAQTAAASGSQTSSSITAGAFLAAAGLVASRRHRAAKTLRRAEPISAAAAAAAAAKAVGAKAAASAGAKTVGATVGVGAGLKGKEDDTSGTGFFGSSFNPAAQIGATEPLGFFDPVGFCKVGDEAGFKNLRRAEVKHGRVAMMAALGAVVQHYVQLPGFDSVPKGLGAVTEAPGSYGFAALFLLSGFLELVAWTEGDKKEPGNFGDPVGLASAGLGAYDEEFRNRELNNGRAAMFAALGIIAAELYTGKDAMEQFSF